MIASRYKAGNHNHNRFYCMRFFSAIGVALALSCCVQAAAPAKGNPAIQWNNAALQGIRDAKLDGEMRGQTELSPVFAVFESGDKR
jgi:hypothetical protein